MATESAILPGFVRDIYADAMTEIPVQFRQAKTERSNRLGYIFFAETKETFERGTALRTYYTLGHKVAESIEKMDAENYEAPFITMNSFAIRRKTRDYLRWINAVSIELDDSEATIADVHHLCEMFDLSNPSLIIKSPKGLHLHWLIEREKAYPNKLRDYDLISSALKKTFSWLQADAVGPERYWRMPTAYNVLHQTDDRFTLTDMKAWATQVLQVEMAPVAADRERKQVKVVHTSVMDNPAIQRLLAGVPYGMDVRNKTAFTLALLLFRMEEMTEDEVYQYLSQEWNPKNEVPIDRRELQKTVRSACSGKYKMAKASYINEILEAIGSNLKFSYRVRSTYHATGTRSEYIKRSELVERIIAYVGERGGEVVISQRDLASELDAAFKSVQNALSEIRSDGLAVVRTKLGRSGGTVITLQTETHDGNEQEERDAGKQGDHQQDQEAPVVVPMPCDQPDRLIQNVIASFAGKRVTIQEIHLATKMPSETFQNVFLQLIATGRIEMRDARRDRTAVFSLQLKDEEQPGAPP